MKKRTTITATKISKMFPQSIDKLPQPAEHAGKRKRWVGFAWVTECDADGTEPLLIEDT